MKTTKEVRAFIRAMNPEVKFDVYNPMYTNKLTDCKLRSVKVYRDGVTGDTVQALRAFCGEENVRVTPSVGSWSRGSGVTVRCLLG